MNNAFLDSVFLDLQELENQPWQAYYAYKTYENPDLQERGLWPLQDVQTTLQELYSQVSSSDAERFLKLKQLASSIKDNDDMNYNQAFRAVNPYINGFLDEHQALLRKQQKNVTCENQRILDFDTQFSIFNLMYTLYDEYFAQLKDLSYVASEVVFTAVSVSDTKYFQVLQQRIKQKYQSFYEEIKNVRIAPPGKFISFTTFAQSEKQFPNAEQATLVELPAYNYIDDIDQFPQFIDRIRLHTGDLGAKLLILDNINQRKTDICLSVSQNLAMAYQLFMQVAVAIAPQVVITNGSCIICFREIVAPMQASLLQILSNFYTTVSYFRANFGRAVEQEKWVYCQKRKRIDKNIANSVVGTLIQYSQQIKQYDIPADIAETFAFPKHFLPIRTDLVAYCKRVNSENFKLQERILKQTIILYARLYDKLDIITQVADIFEDQLKFFDAQQEISKDRFLAECVAKNPNIGILFPSNEKREIMVYRYLNRINPAIQRFDLQYILYDTQKSKTVRFQNTEVKRQSVRVLRVQSQQEKEELAKIERERLEQQKKEQAELEKHLKQEQDKKKPEQEKPVRKQKEEPTATQSLPPPPPPPVAAQPAQLPPPASVAQTFPVATQNFAPEMQKPQDIRFGRPQKQPFLKDPKLQAEQFQSVISQRPPIIEPQQKPQVRRAPAPSTIPGKFEGKNVLKGKQLDQRPAVPEKPKDPPKETKKKEKNLLANIMKYAK